MAGGYYTDVSGHQQAFVVSLRDGRWSKAIQLPGLATLNTGGLTSVQSVSCASAGDCAAGGSYQTTHMSSDDDPSQAFVVSEKNGRWGAAAPVVYHAYLVGAVASVSCPSAGNCAAAGGYSGDGVGPAGTWVMNEKNKR